VNLTAATFFFFKPTKQSSELRSINCEIKTSFNDTNQGFLEAVKK
jgi:hypothetical protein